MYIVSIRLLLSPLVLDVRNVNKNEAKPSMLTY